jgi:hypothetical protein
MKADLRTIERVADFTYTDDGGFIAAGRKDGLFKSFDLLSWTKLSPEGQDFWSLGRDQLGNIYAGTDNGRIYLSPDNGLTWEYTKPVTGRIWGFYNSDNYIFAGNYSRVLRKLPDSTTWNITELNTSQYFTVFGDDLNNLYAATSNYVFISTNEGNTWTERGFFSNEHMHRAIFNTRLIGSFNDETGWFGVGWGAAVSNDQGITWQWAQTGLPPRLSGFKLAKSGTDTYLSTNAAGVYLSTDFGGSWSPLNNGLNSAVTSKVLLDTDGTLFTVSYSNGISKSSDGGNTWRMINNGLNNVYMYSIVLDDNGYLMAGSSREYSDQQIKGKAGRGPHLQVIIILFICSRISRTGYMHLIMAQESTGLQILGKTGQR